MPLASREGSAYLSFRIERDLHSCEVTLILQGLLEIENSVLPGPDRRTALAAVRVVSIE